MADHTLDPSLLDSHFKDASAWLTSAPAAANLSIDTKLEIYGLYKVATVGFRPFVRFHFNVLALYSINIVLKWILLSLQNSDIPQPGFFSLPAAKAKYSAWQSQGEKYSKLSSESIADQSDAAAAAAAQDAGRAQAKERYLEIAQQIGWTAASEDGQGSGDGKRSGMGMAVSTMRNDDDELPPPGE
ncbi:hypothetical protein QFC19_003633 [Naganishia cerealis]|uniref:Uncharacterized protein n=1 Tax=Naganishia cerealis TaxID=610337 RepID=A0ACC2W0G6_9TREE|nr:hypothetical protein QFC19_003633 [Naganishia cerealis]